MAKISNFLIGDPSQANISAIMLTLQHSYSGRGLFRIRNFDNTGIPGLMAGAVLDVAGSLYLEETELVCQYRNGTGEILNIASAPDGQYHMIAIPSADSVIIAAVSGLSPVFDTDYGAFYENGTANRVLGGFTKTGSSYSTKWAYLFEPHMNTFVQVDSNGVSIIGKSITSQSIDAQAVTVRNYALLRHIIPQGDAAAAAIDFTASLWDAGVDYNVYYSLWDGNIGGNLSLASDKIFQLGAQGQYTSYSGSPQSAPAYTKFFLKGRFNLQVKRIDGSTSYTHYLVQVANGDNPATVRYSDAGSLTQGAYIQAFSLNTNVFSYTSDFNGWYALVHNEPSSQGGCALQMRISLIDYAPQIQALS